MDSKKVTAVKIEDGKLDMIDFTSINQASHFYGVSQAAIKIRMSGKLKNRVRLLSGLEFFKTEDLNQQK
jgi:hypothetical protein